MPSDSLALLGIAPVSSGPCHLASFEGPHYTVETTWLDEQLVVAADVESTVVAGFAVVEGSRLYLGSMSALGPL